MKQFLSIFLILSLGMVLFHSCEKVERQAPNNFTKKSIWKVTEISIGYDNVLALPEWEINTETSSVWCHDGGTCATFYWNFSSNYNSFNFYLDTNDPENKMNMAYKQCENLSGTYDVIISKKDLYEFETNERVGYVGPKVYIRIE